jgi:putative transposase
MSSPSVYISFSEEENIHGTNYVCFVLYFLGLSFRSTAKALDPFIEKRSHVVIWNWVQLFNPNRFYLKQTTVTAFIIDETMLHIGSDNAWLWVALEEPIHKQVLGVYVSRHRNMLVAESFLRSLVGIYGKHPIYSDGGTWYPEACCCLDLRHTLHSPFEKSIIERTIEYFKDRTENFDDYYPCCRHDIEYDLTHVHNWLSMFVFMHNVHIQHIKFMNLVRLMRVGRTLT